MTDLDAELSGRIIEWSCGDERCEGCPIFSVWLGVSGYWHFLAAAEERDELEREAALMWADHGERLPKMAAMLSRRWEDVLESPMHVAMWQVETLRAAPAAILEQLDAMSLEQAVADGDQIRAEATPVHEALRVVDQVFGKIRAGELDARPGESVVVDVEIDRGDRS